MVCNIIKNVFREIYMKVILLDKIDNLGGLGEEIIVRSGYARNFLIPKSKAIVATKKNIKIFKEQQIKLNEKIAEIQNKAKSYSTKINELGHITISVKSGIEGKLFGSIGAKDIANVLSKTIGFKILKSQIRLPRGSALRAIGTYQIKVHIYKKIFSILDVNIIDASAHC